MKSLENSQAAKERLVESTPAQRSWNRWATGCQHYGMYAADDAAQLTYVQNGIAAVLNSAQSRLHVLHRRREYRQGCHAGTEQLSQRGLRPCRGPRGRLHACPRQRRQRRGLPFAKGFGWGNELNLGTASKLFGFGHGQGYPKGARGA